MQRRDALATLAATALYASLSGCSDDTPGEDEGLLFGRVWFEKKPASPQERVHQLALAKRPAQGVFVEASGYKLTLEVFKYEREGARMKVTFPQDGRTGSFDFKITACHEDDFDLCLELSANPWSGPKKYFAVREQASGALADAEVAERARRVAAIVGTAE